MADPVEQTGRRCDLGCESWPDADEFSKCLRCGGPTTRYSNLQPLSLAEARSIKRHVEFERFYEDRCKRLGVPPSGALPAWYMEQMEPLPQRLSRRYLLPRGAGGRA
jgi:hypothetical protein